MDYNKHVKENHDYIKKKCYCLLPPTTLLRVDSMIEGTSWHLWKQLVTKTKLL